MTGSGSAGERAALLARQGRTPEALLMLGAAASRNDADALFTLGMWRLTGEFVARDLALSHDLFRRAAEAGHRAAGRIHTAFVANGTGGPADWRAAVGLLRARAASDPDAAAQLKIVEAMPLGPDGEPASVPASRLLSETPHVELFPKLFTPAECRFLIDAAAALMTASVVVDPQTGRQVPNPIRTSDAAGFPLALESPAVHALNRRLAAASGTPVGHGEPLQVLRYRPGQEYRAHSDALPAAENQRILTMLVYLNSGYDGGETQFLATKLSMKGEVGDALLFRNVTPDGRPDQSAVHAGLPVRRGIKLIASRWIREKPLDLSGPPR